MKIDARVVAFGQEFVKDRLKGVADWYSPIKFEWEVINAGPGADEYKPWGDALAVYDDPVLNRWQDDHKITVLAAPYAAPTTPQGQTIVNHALVSGIVNFNWNGKNDVISVFTNETDHTQVNLIDQGDAFSLWLKHELSHLLYYRLGMPDKTHEYFYSGHPEKAQAEIIEVVTTHLDLQ